jgi:hypothetical protein
MNENKWNAKRQGSGFGNKRKVDEERCSVKS